MNKVPEGKKLECAVCPEILEPEIAWPQCGKCFSFLHFKCSNNTMHRGAWKAMTLDEKRNWLCPPCHNVSTDTGSDYTTMEFNGPKKLSLVKNGEGNIVSKIDAILEQLKELPIIKQQLTVIQEDNRKVHNRLAALESHVSALELENSNLKSEVTELQMMQQENFQYQRRNNIIITNVPGEANEKEEILQWKM
jgi:hypothetical protein